MKSPTLKKLFKEFTHNELALYLLLGVALLNLLTYLQYNYLGGIIIFLFIGLLATHYTKNMVIVLGAAILITNLLVSLGFLSNLGYKEGLDNKETPDKKEDSDKKDNSDTKCKKDSDCKENQECEDDKCVEKYNNTA